MKKITTLGIIILVALGYFVFRQSNQNTANTETVETVQPENTKESVATVIKNETDEGVEIFLVDRLDGILGEYCLDIAGGNQNVDPNNGLQVHTCYSYKGDLGTDQIFSTTAFAENRLYMPIYDVCAYIPTLETGSEVELTACNENATAITFNTSGTLTPVDAPNMCLTAAPESRMGRGSEHQIRALTLELCSDELAAYQTWGVRSEA